MLSEEMVKHLPDKPQPDQFEAWYHSAGTQWLIAHLQFDHQLILDLMAELDTGSTDTDSVEFYRYQGDARTITKIIDGMKGELEDAV